MTGAGILGPLVDLLQRCDLRRSQAVGGVSAFVGDKATATGWLDGRLYIIFVQRGAESIASPGVSDEINLR